MTEQYRLLIPFSGQADSVDLCLFCIENYPEEQIVLLFVQNIGFRPDFMAPVETAKELAVRFPAIQELLVADARTFLQDGLRRLPPEVTEELGLRTICAACQGALLLVSALVARRLGARLVLGPREALGEDLDTTLRALAGHAKLERGAIPVAGRLQPNTLSLPIAASQRCALAGHHGDTVPLRPTSLKTLKEAMLKWSEELVSSAEELPLSSLILESHPLHLDGAAP